MRRWLGRVVLSGMLASACSTGGAGDAPQPSTAPSDTTARTDVGDTLTTSTETPVAAPPPVFSTVPSDSDPDRVRPDGFELVAATVTTADGEICDLCLWLAETPLQRASGLMFVTDLGGADGMAFRYPWPHTGNFWMKNTVLPLSIAFFDPDGGYIDEFDMEPCTTPTCPRYRTPRDFLVAIETVQGDLADIGIGPGSTLDVTDLPCR